MPRKQDEKSLDLEQVIEDIRSKHRKRMFTMNQRQRLELALGSYLRTHLGWLKEDTSGYDKKVNAAAVKDSQALMDNGAAMMAGKIVDPSLRGWVECKDIIEGSLKASHVFRKIEDEMTKDLEKLASQLSVWAWAKDIRGFSARGLATIVGEAGDLSKYRTRDQLWKRMGLALMDRADGSRVRQGGLPKSASKEEWIEHGYNAERRSKMSVVGESLLRAGGFYYDVYCERKNYERNMATEKGLLIAPAAEIKRKKDKGNYVSDGHIHKRSQRYMEKYLLKHLWQVWNADRLQTVEMPYRAAERDRRAPPDLEAAA